jgi:murein DD-endopeptidase MepM/ murein hydrolase activator NlpD
MRSRQAKRISILLVPEDNSEPRSFRLRTSTVKVLYVVGSILLVHIIIGAIYYFKYAGLLDYNQQILSRNAQLQEDNKRVISLSNQFGVLEQEYKKVRSLLGVDNDHQGFHAETNGDANQVEVSIQPDKLLEAVNSEMDEVKGLDFYETRNRVLVANAHNQVSYYPENIPSMMPVKGFLTLDFQKEAWFSAKSHSGVDIVAKKGTIIRAAGAGVVIFANWTTDLGNLIIVDHGGGYLSFYGHNQRFLVAEKTHVQRGDAIALLGTSGKSSGPHLHFEIWQDGVPVNPKDYILDFDKSITTKF